MNLSRELLYCSLVLSVMISASAAGDLSATETLASADSYNTFQGIPLSSSMHCRGHRKEEGHLRSKRTHNIFSGDPREDAASPPGQEN
jgi:hypothetical protein